MKCLVCIFGLGWGVLAFGSDKIVVPQAYRNVAKAYGIPYKVLFAIGMQESQRDLGNGKVLPWPWTLNIAGKGSYYDSSSEMKDALFAAVDEGKIVDVGLMQINTRWHLGKSYSLIDLMRPEDNLNIAAQILSIEHERCGGSEYDWACAVGHYHSHREKRAEAYAKKVMRWVKGLE